MQRRPFWKADSHSAGHLLLVKTKC